MIGMCDLAGRPVGEDDHGMLCWTPRKRVCWLLRWLWEA